MICGVIDIGSNSVLLVVGEGDKVIFDADRVTRLGEGLNLSKRLKFEAMTRTASAVCEFKNLALKMGAKKVLAVGTMALRMAENAGEFVDLVRKKCSIDVKILSGEEEASLSFRGAVQSLDLKGRVTVSDIGGRSTEIAVGEGNRVEYLKSFSIGALTLMEKFSLGQSPIFLNTLHEMIEYSRQTMKGISIRADHLVGIGGTITNLAAIRLKLKTYDPQKVHGLILSHDEIYSITLDLSSKPVQKRREVVGLQPERADTIVPGSAIILGLMEALNFDRIVVSDRALRHALLWDCSREARKAVMTEKSNP